MKDNTISSKLIPLFLAVIMLFGVIAVTPGSVAAEEPLESNGTYYIGETIQTSEYNESEEFKVQYNNSNGNWETIENVTVNNDSVLAIDTSTSDESIPYPENTEYRLYNASSGTTEYNFSVLEQSLNVDPSANQTINPDDDEVLTSNVTTNRGESHTLLLSSPDVSNISNLNDNIRFDDSVTTQVVQPSTGASYIEVRGVSEGFQYQVLLSSLEEDVGENVELVFSSPTTITEENETVMTSQSLTIYSQQGVRLDSESRTIIYQGQTAWSYNNVSANENYDLIRENEDGSTEFVNSYTADGDGFLVFDTTDISEGKYRLEGGDGNVIELRVVEHEFSVEMDPEVTRGQGSDASTTVEVTSENRKGFIVELSVSDIEPQDLSDRIQGGSPTVTEDGVIMFVPENTGNATISTQDLTDGEYNVNVDVLDTTAQGNDTFVVTEEEPKVEFQNNLQTGQRGEIYTYTINFENTRSANFVLGGDNEAFTLDAIVKDGGGNRDDATGTATIVINTHYLTRDVTEAVWVAESTNSIEIQNHDQAIADEPIHAGAYEIDLYTPSNERRHDVGLMKLEEPDPELEPLMTGAAPQTFGEENEEYVIRKVTYSEDIENINVTKEDEEAVNADVYFNENDFVVIDVEIASLTGHLESLGGAKASELQRGSGSVYEKTGLWIAVERMEGFMNRDDTVTLDDRMDVRLLEEQNTLRLIIPPQKYEALEYGEGINVDVGIDAENSVYYEEDTQVNESIGFADEELSFGNKRGHPYVELLQSGSAAVFGETNMAPGTTFHLELESYEPIPHFTRKEVVVQQDGSFETTYDLSAIPEGIDFTLRFEESELNYTSDGLVVTEYTPLSPQSDGGIQSPRLVETGQNVQLTVDAFDPQGKSLDYEWQVSNETIAEGKSVTHSFYKSGQYNVKVIVTDESGESNTFQTSVTVQGTELDMESAGEEISFNDSESELDYEEAPEKPDDKKEDKTKKDSERTLVPNLPWFGILLSLSGVGIIFGLGFWVYKQYSESEAGE